MNSLESILMAAKQLFCEKGFAKVSMSDVARDAGISRVTLYKHVASKEDLLRKLMLAHIEAGRMQMQQYLDKSGCVWERIQTMLLELAQPALNDISHLNIRRELIYVAQQHCQDLVIEKRQSHRDGIQALLDACDWQNCKLPLAIGELANHIETVFDGLIGSSLQEDLAAGLSQAIDIIKAGIK